MDANRTVCYKIRMNGEYIKAVGRGGAIADDVTFAAFRRLMGKRALGLEDLVPMFRGELEDGCRDILTRIMKTEVAHDEVVIPYRCLLKFYLKERKAYEAVQEARKSGVRTLDIVKESSGIRGKVALRPQLAERLR